MGNVQHFLKISGGERVIIRYREEDVCLQCMNKCNKEISDNAHMWCTQPSPWDASGAQNLDAAHAVHAAVSANSRWVHGK